jgi:hypothetical protein
MLLLVCWLMSAFLLAVVLSDVCVSDVWSNDALQTKSTYTRVAVVVKLKFGFLAFVW